MKEKAPDIDRMIMESHYLDSLEREDRSVGLMESERKQYLDTIQSLNDTITSLNATIKSLRTDIQEIKESTEKEKNKSDYQMKVLLKKLTDQTEEMKALRRELKKYKDRNDRSNRDQFGKRSQKSKTKQDDIPSRQEESDKFDGTPESIQTEETVQPQEAEVSSSEQECPQQPKERGPRGFYKTMRADMVEIVKCDLNAVPKGMRFICTKTVSEYEKMQMCTQTVTNWLHIGAEFLRLLLPSLKEHLLRNLDVLHIDETWTNIRIKTKEFLNGHYVKKYVWVIVNKLTKVVFFLYDNDEQDSRAVCWAHARAKLWDSATIAKDEDADALVKEIGYLYGVEVENRVENRSLDEIKARRNQQDVIDTMKRMPPSTAPL